VPQFGHARWGSLGEWQCGHSDLGGGLSFHLAFLEAVLERDFLRLGTAIFYLRFWLSLL
jgi:hypothetical protein